MMIKVQAPDDNNLGWQPDIGVVHDDKGKAPIDNNLRWQPDIGVVHIDKEKAPDNNNLGWQPDIGVVHDDKGASSRWQWTRKPLSCRASIMFIYVCGPPLPDIYTFLSNAYSDN